MNQASMPGAPISNLALQPFSILIGHWETTGTHPLALDTPLHGHASFEWLENGAFLLMRSAIDDPRFPSTTAIFGTDDTEGTCYMLTFDERGVSRKHDTTLQGNLWKWWRLTPGFSQRYEFSIVDDGNTIIGRGELSKDGGTWEKDLDLTYKRVEQTASGGSR